VHRSCFIMSVAPSRMADYERMHREAWPELLDALHRTGWRNYSLFLRDDGFLVGYVESEDWARARREMDADPVSPRWSVEMDRLVVPGTTMRWLEPAGTSGPERSTGADAVRRVECPPPSADLGPDVRVARFGPEPALAYLELPAEHPLATAPTRFRRVFDLEGQLRARGRTLTAT
jgi:L-rhamnose mutarotase